MARQTDDELQTDPRNPGDTHAEELFGQEGAGTSSSGKKADENSVRDQELKGSWDTKLDDEYKPGQVLKATDVRTILKKRGPLGLIALIGLGGGIFGTMLFSPGLLFVQMKEALLGRFNTQLASMEIRSNILLDKKIGRAMTSGVCSGSINIKCKFSTISEKQAARLKAAGIEIDESTSSKFGNRVRPTRLSFNGVTMDASEFMQKYKTDLSLRTAMRGAYSPKFAGFTDRIWNSVAKKVGVVKGKTLPRGSPDEKAAAIDDQVKNGAKLNVLDDGVVCDDKECRDRQGNTLSEKDAAEARAAKAAAAAALEEAGDSSTRAAAEAIESTAKAVGGGAANAVANFLKVTGPADMACQAYTAVRALGYAAKTVRAIQLMRYVMVFLNVTDQIVAGTADEEDVAYLGGVLTSVAIDAASGAQRKAAMDSFGMQYAMYGTVGQKTTYLSQFMAGGGLTGDLIMITDFINSQLGGSPMATCKTLTNGWVQAGSVAAGIALLLIPGANVVFTAADIAKGIVSVALSVALAVLPEMLKDIVAGNVVQGIIGEDSGDASATGAGLLMGEVCKSGGCAPLTVDQAVAYSKVQEQTVAQYAADERATLSPFDASNPNTFLGTIASKLLPYTSQTSTLSGTLSKTANIFSSAVGALTPKTSALSDEQLRESYESCDDEDYDRLGLAVTPLCTPVFGVPVEYLQKDPDVVIDELVAAGQLNLETGIPGGKFTEYIQNCIEREAPFGDSGQDLQGSDGSECLIDTPMEANYYLFYIDGRIDAAMDGPVESGVVGGNESKQELAAKIVAKNKVTYLQGTESPKLEDIANGTIDGDAEPCGINIWILRIIDAITDKHSIKISDMNRYCIRSTVGGASSTASRHYAGNGSALDIATADGVILTGQDSKSLELIDIAMPIMSEAATSVGSFAQLGQKYGALCGTRNLTLLPGITEIKDKCHHLHIDVPPTADPSLLHTLPGMF